MMENSASLKILLVEDELIIAEHISSELQVNGYEVLDIITKGERVPGFVAKTRPDLIIMDIQLAGQLDGIETAKIIAETDNIPVIFLTANVDNNTFEKSKEAYPYAFIGKPFKTEELVRAIEVTYTKVQQLANQNTKEEAIPDEINAYKSDSIFIRDKGKMVKINLSEVYYIEAERNYSKIHTAKKSFLVSSPLKSVEEKINSTQMQRVHRSYMVNIAAIDELDEHYVFINSKSIPVSKTFKKELSKKLKLI